MAWFQKEKKKSIATSVRLSTEYTFYHGSSDTNICAFACVVFEVGRFSGFNLLCLLDVRALDVRTKYTISDEITFQACITENNLRVCCKDS